MKKLTHLSTDDIALADAAMTTVKCPYCRMQIVLQREVVDTQHLAYPQFRGKAFFRGKAVPEYVIAASGWVFCSFECAVFD